MTALGVLADVLAIAAVPVFLTAAYLALLALTTWPNGKPAVPRAHAPRVPTTRFDVVVPAHDEAAGIAETIASLRAVDYPAALFRVVVVADNCTDATAERASEAGAVVWERRDPERRGKGYALAHGFATSLAAGGADAVVVVDADSTVSSNLLSAFDAALAVGTDVAQASYTIRNPIASWRTRLLRLGFTLFHDIRSLARERLGLSCGLRGNGMCFRTTVLRQVPYGAFSIVEDLEYGLQLGVAGVRVAYVPNAHVYGEMPTTSSASRSQRDRWERGRRAIARAYAPRLLREAMRRRDALLLDLLFDVIVPPLSRVVAAVVAGATLTSVAIALGAPATPAAVLWALSVLSIAVYVARGCVLTGDGVSAVAVLAWAPVYMVWKLTVAPRRARRDDEWVRTSRAAPAPRGGS